MACICVFDLKEIRHSGSNIGSDWAYTISIDGETFSSKASVHSGAKITNRIKIQHRWTLEDKACGATLEIPLSVRAKESDLLFSDRGVKEKIIEVECPCPGGAPFKLPDYEVKVDVRERPGFLAGINYVTFVFDIMAFSARD